jgi:hypothetical protein
VQAERGRVDSADSADQDPAGVVFVTVPSAVRFILPESVPLPTSMLNCSLPLLDETRLRRYGAASFACNGYVAAAIVSRSLFNCASAATISGLSD